MCPRCELQIRVDIFDGHWHSHSSEILPWLFLGGRRNADNEKELVERTKVSHILNVAKECDLDRRLEGMFVYKKIEMHDSKDFDLLGSITDAVQFIQDAHDASPQNRVLVHCVQGISRSASVVVAYLVHSGMSLQHAYEHVRARRKIAAPRANFIEQLGIFESSLNPGLERPTLTPDEIVECGFVLDVDQSAYG
mmetsp:Transcript_45849/g.112693  ORF Transcript_45849/g.112693 Transcript_45849/m.112693 type:complete len:194 (-) Transcript_45849:99-680(-)